MTTVQFNRKNTKIKRTAPAFCLSLTPLKHLKERVRKTSANSQRFIEKEEKVERSIKSETVEGRTGQRDLDRAC